MRHTIKLVLLLLLLCPSLYGQTRVNLQTQSQGPASTQPPISCASSMTFTASVVFTADYFFNLNCNVTSSTIAIGSAVVGNEIQIGYTNVSPGFTFTWPVNIIGVPATPVVGGNISATFQYCGTVTNGSCTANSWWNLDQGPSGVVLGAASTYIDAATFGVTANTQYVLDATWTINTQNVSSATGAFKSTDTGKACVGISNSGTATLPVGTFTFLTSTTGTCSVNATASQTNGTFVWGTDDTTAMQAAWTAILTRPALGAAANASCGGKFLIPYGFIWVTQNPATTATPASCGQFDSEFPQYYVEGAGYGATVFFLAPSFLFNTTTAGGCRFGSLQSTCLWGTNFTHFRAFGATTLGFVPTFSGVASVLTLGTNGTGEQINIFNMGNPTNLTGISILGQTDMCSFCVVDGAGSTGFNVSAQAAMCFNCWTNVGLNVTGSALFNDYGGGYNPHANQDGVVVSGTMNMFGTYANAISTNFAACSLGANAVLNIYATNSPVSGLGACRNAGVGAGILFRGNNATVSLSSANVTGGATGGAISTNGVNTGDKIIDLGNNSINGTMANLQAAGATWLGYGNGPNIRGFCTGVATASSTLALRISGSSTSGTGVATTCTSTTIDAGQVMQTAGTLIELLVNAGTGGVNASSGVVTVLKNGAAQTMTCTLGTGTSCQDGTHTVAYAIGDLISIQFTTQTSETLANVKATVIAN